LPSPRPRRYVFGRGYIDRFEVIGLLNRNDLAVGLARRKRRQGQNRIEGIFITPAGSNSGDRLEPPCRPPPPERRRNHMNQADGRGKALHIGVDVIVKPIGLILGYRQRNPVADTLNEDKPGRPTEIILLKKAPEPHRFSRLSIPRARGSLRSNNRSGWRSHKPRDWPKCTLPRE
jgi:hypothetical protein